MTKKDFGQIMLNIIAFLILYFSSGGNGSFWGFLTFNIISCIILIEILLSNDRTAVWVWATKAITYIFLVAKFSHNMGEVKPEYILMITISIVSLLISRHLIKKRSVALWGQNIAYVIGGIMYVMAITASPDSFGTAHILFWLVNAISYSYLVYEIIDGKKKKENLIIPVFALVVCLIYIACIAITGRTVKSKKSPAYHRRLFSL